MVRAADDVRRGRLELSCGCSSVEDQAEASQEDTAEVSSPEARAAQAKVEDASRAVDAFTAPGDAVEGVDALKGKTVYYVPANGQGLS